MSKLNLHRPAVCAIILSAALSTQSVAAGSHSDDHGHGHNATAIGTPGQADDADRTLQIVMTDDAYDLETISVTNGETIRFVISNAGVTAHEFNIGTAAMHLEHRGEMFKMAPKGTAGVDRDAMGAMAHDDPNIVLLEPGESGEITWTFDTEASLQFACNIPGHYEAGMFGEIKIHDAPHS